MSSGRAEEEFGRLSSPSEEHHSSGKWLFETDWRYGSGSIDARRVGCYYMYDVFSSSNGVSLVTQSEMLILFNQCLTKI
jgi:hypothetical protein